MAKNSTLLIRHAEDKDVEQIYRIHMAAIKCSTCYSHDEIESWSSGQSVEKYLPFIKANEMIVAEDEDQGRVVGFGHLTFVTPSEGKSETEAFNGDEQEEVATYIKGLFVEPASEGRGVGTRLMERLESWAICKGAVKLNVFSSINAVSFYEKFGFVRIESSKHQMNDGNTIMCCKMTKSFV